MRSQNLTAHIIHLSTETGNRMKDRLSVAVSDRAHLHFRSSMKNTKTLFSYTLRLQICNCACHHQLKKAEK